MLFYLALLIILLLLIGGIIYWIFKTIGFFRNKQNKKGWFHLSLILIIIAFVCWELRIIPIASDNDFKNKTENLTGKKFWSWNIYQFDDFGIRGEGFTLESYRLSNKMTEYFKNPDEDFFQNYPNKNIGNAKWKKTPISIEDTKSLKFVTPIYGSWSEKRQNEVREIYHQINEIIYEPDSYYCFIENNQTDFYLISPKQKIIIWINHNM